MGDVNAEPICLPANHSTMVKFRTKGEPYKAVLYYLDQRVDGAKAAVNEKWLRADAELRGA